MKKLYPTNYHVIYPTYTGGKKSCGKPLPEGVVMLE
jgi:hypothetical protein